MHCQALFSASLHALQSSLQSLLGGSTPSDVAVTYNQGLAGGLADVTIARESEVAVAHHGVCEQLATSGVII